jgi:molecular chaperone DnaJ
MRDYYAVLGIGVGATAAEVRRAYRRLARTYSPDVNLWEPAATRLFQEIAEAYRVLGDPAARALYDRHGAVARGEPGSSVGGRRGDDLHVPVELSFRQAMTGVATELALERLAPCDPCRSSGARPDAAPAPCAHCAGSGMVWHLESVPEAEPCRACDGRGERVAEACPACRGRGVAPARAVVRVAIPPGMDSGAQLRVAGEGHAGPFGGPRGDLIVMTRVHEDPEFTRKGDNLYCEAPVTVAEAVLGARVRVRAPDGELGLAIPPGTQPGQVFRIRGRGVPRLSGTGRGDLYVTARVLIPRDLDARTQELFREVARLLPASRTVMEGRATA